MSMPMSIVFKVPLKAKPRDRVLNYVTILDAENQFALAVLDDGCEARAEAICRAVNEYDALKAVTP